MKLTPITKETPLAFYQQLNAEAFGEVEGFPIETFLAAQDKGLVEIYSIDEEEPLGFCVVSQNKEVCYLGYFAIAKEKRGQGYGSEAIELIKATFPQQLVLEIEKVDKKTSYESLKVRRRRFYLSHHLHLSHYEDLFRGEPYQIMCTGPDLRLNAFKDILEKLKAMDYRPELYHE